LPPLDTAAGIRPPGPGSRLRLRPRVGVAFPPRLRHDL
ncbi:MAG: hypothetical protein AVDCRST_MAG33-3118, partial [uncultured Thermomicrobiales bacterium]